MGLDSCFHAKNIMCSIYFVFLRFCVLFPHSPCVSAVFIMIYELWMCYVKLEKGTRKVDLYNAMSVVEHLFNFFRQFYITNRMIQRHIFFCFVAMVNEDLFTVSFWAYAFRSTTLAMSALKIYYLLVDVSAKQKRCFVGFGFLLFSLLLFLSVVRIWMFPFFWQKRQVLFYAFRLFLYISK